MAKLSAALKDRAVTEIVVSKVEIEPASDGKRIAVLTLKNPLEEVRGSQRIPDPASEGQLVVMTAYDVSVVKVREELFDEIETENPDGTGKIKSNFRLDVAKRSGDVWLTKEPFTAVGARGRNDRQAATNARIADSIRQRRMKSADSDTNAVPETPEKGATPTVTAGPVKAGS